MDVNRNEHRVARHCTMATIMAADFAGMIADNAYI